MNKLVTLRFAKLVQNQYKISIKLEEISEVQKLEVISTPESTDGYRSHDFDIEVYEYPIS